MVLAMWAGMMLLGGLDRGILALAGTSVSSVRDSAPEVVALVMAFNMTVGMTLWMRHRRHSWAMRGDGGSDVRPRHRRHRAPLVRSDPQRIAPGASYMRR
jgi:hypothetical protein